MKYLPISLSAAIVLFVSACGNRKSAADASPETNQTQQDTATKKYYPVADWIRSEISYVDSTPLAIVQSTTIGNRKDSGFITPAQFNQQAAQFLVPGLEADSLEKNFTENSFFDKTTGFLTFTYSTRDKGLPLQRVDVLVAKGDLASRVKSVYIETFGYAGDTVVTRKMFWTSRHDFLVLTNLQPKGKPALMQQLKIVWDAD